VTLWSGRFDTEPAAALWTFTVDHSDRRLLVDDLTGSLAHVAMLAAVDLISGDEAADLADGLRRIEAEAGADEFVFLDTDEDVHSAVERRLRELKGPVAGKLHTGRSRNDQVVLDLRLYLRRSAGNRTDDLLQFVGILADKAAEVGELVVPSYTHLQQAQAVPLAHHLLAYAWMLLRDVARFREVRHRIDVSPLGAGAGGGSSLPLDPELVARELDMAGAFENSLDAVASRDFVAEYAFCAAQAMVHLSRLSEEIVLWSSAEFGWTSTEDAFMTGSSAMPQKRNPDVAELTRGRAAGVIGDTAALLSLQKGLPLAYNRDLQEDKRLVFHADDALAGALPALGGMLQATRFHPPAPSSDVTALDLAEVLVARGVPFREAHEAVGALVTSLGGDGRSLEAATHADLQGVHSEFLSEDLVRTDPLNSASRRASAGGGSMASVARQLAAIRSRVSGS
jgi:argininosuccinate lyase